MIANIFDLVAKLPGIEERIAAQLYLEFLIERNRHPQNPRCIRDIYVNAPRGVNIDNVSMDIWDTGMCCLVGNIHNGQASVRQFQGKVTLYDAGGMEVGSYSIKMPGIGWGEQYQFIKVIQEIPGPVVSCRLSFDYGKLSEVDVVTCYDFEGTGNTFVVR